MDRALQITKDANLAHAPAITKGTGFAVCRAGENFQ
jgi:hypothetical protein